MMGRMQAHEFALSVLRSGAPEELAPVVGGRAAAWGIVAELEQQGEELTLLLAGDGEAVVTLWLWDSFWKGSPGQLGTGSRSWNERTVFPKGSA